MKETEFPVQSNKTLYKASAIAICLAVTIFMVTILPAEYHRDPTGVGHWLGLMDLSKPSTENLQETLVANQTENTSIDKQQHSVKVIVPANSGVEYKFKLKQFSKISYHWNTHGVPLYFDFHGEPKGDTTGYFESYTIATTNEVSGSMTVPFEGVHGWYWKNTSHEDVIVTLQTSGDYEVVGLIH